eukprot:SAG25_NODE_1418_length_3078_cov_5.140651_2_plen_44_part_00
MTAAGLEVVRSVRKGGGGAMQISWVVYRSDDSGPPGAPPGLLS